MNIATNVDLNKSQDRAIFYKQLEVEKDLPYEREIIKRSIEFISSKLQNEEWLRIYPFTSPRGNISVSLRVDQTRSTALDFFHEVIPLGMQLMDLQFLAGFSKIVNRLDIPFHERISTIFEVGLAAAYKNAGYTIDLEPENGKGGRSDLRIMSKSLKKWLYFECKAQNPSDSQVLNARQKLIEELSNQIFMSIEGILNVRHRIDVQLPSPSMQQNKKNNLIEHIASAIRRNETGQWKECHNLKYRISNRIDPPEIPVKHIFGGLLMTKAGTAVPLTESVVFITCPLGNVIRNALNLITDARKQLPDQFTGIIALKISKGDIILNNIKQRIQQTEYRRIAAIIIIDNNSFLSIKNGLHGDVSDTILNVPSSLIPTKKISPEN